MDALDEVGSEIVLAMDVVGMIAELKGLEDSRVGVSSSVRDEDEDGIEEEDGEDSGAADIDG